MKHWLTIILYTTFLLPAFAQQNIAETNFRTRLEQRGLTFGVSYITEGFTDGHGGQLLGSFDTSIALDLSRMRLGRGQVMVSAQRLHGHGINESRVGALQVPSNLENEGFGKFVEAWYADSYLNGRIKIKAGRQYADGDFGTLDYGADFLNSSYGVIPNSPMPTYPDPELGASIWASASERVSFGFGAFRGGSLAKDAAFLVAETKLQATETSTVRLGYWRQARNRGAYAAAEHRFGGENAPAVFGRWGWAPFNRNEIGAYTGAGFVYRGVGFGITSVRAGGWETIYELFYKYQITAKLTLQPDMQWIANPGATGAPRATVAGLRMAVEF